MIRVHGRASIRFKYFCGGGFLTNWDFVEMAGQTKREIAKKGKGICEKGPDPHFSNDLEG
jgi:hypothetical protein